VTPSHYLARNVLAGSPQLAISESEYVALSHARRTLTDALAFEQKFELLLANYLALELAATEWSLRAKVEHQFSYSVLSEVFRDANRHIVNLLSGAKAYIDQVKQDFAHLTINPSFETSAAKRLSAEYDSAKEYRFMEALRNHIQHRNPPVHKITKGNQRASANDWVDSLSIRADRTNLEEDGKFKGTVLEEMDAEVDLRLSARSYIASLSACHVDLRRLVTSEVDAARTLIRKWIEQYAEISSEGVIGLHAYRSEDGEVKDSVLLMLDWDDVRRDLAEKNRFAISLEPRRIRP
jgi:hypothetical protein